jgi:hypothetical protein
MTKRAEQNKVCDKDGHTLERNTYTEDNNLLPSADELSRLNQVDPSLITWIKDRTTEEQNARIRFNDSRIDLAKKEYKYVHTYNFVALFMAFIIVVLFLGFAGYLILNNKETIGTIFAGSTLVLIVSYFLKTKSKK